MTFGSKSCFIVDIKGLTAGDFATVKKKVDFLGVNNLDEITKMLQDEVKVKNLKNSKIPLGFRSKHLSYYALLILNFWKKSFVLTLKDSHLEVFCFP